MPFAIIKGTGFLNPKLVAVRSHMVEEEVERSKPCIEDLADASVHPFHTSLLSSCSGRLGTLVVLHVEGVHEEVSDPIKRRQAARHHIAFEVAGIVMNEAGGVHIVHAEDALEKSDLVCVPFVDEVFISTKDLA